MSQVMERGGSTVLRECSKTEIVLSRQWYILHYHRSTLLLPLRERLLLVVVEWKKEAK